MSNASPTGNGAAPAPAPAPHIQFAAPVLDFGKADAGQIVKCDFLFTNTGSAMLEITSVKPGCGCTTTTNWDRLVAPGKSGNIPIQFNPGAYNGMVVKNVMVACNDPAQTNITLQLKGTIFRPIDVSPPMVYFSLVSDSRTNETKVVRMVSNLDEALALSAPECTNRAFKVELVTVKPGKEFELRVATAVPLSAATVQAAVTVKTSSARQPLIAVNAFAFVQPALLAMPSQIFLPAGPLAAETRATVAIRNNGSKPVVLSEPSLNASNVQVRMQEAQPGRFFNFTLTFPPGFQTQTGQSAVFTVKSDHPQFPLVKVPVFQAQRAALAASVPGVPFVSPPIRSSTAPPKLVEVTPTVAYFNVSREAQTPETKVVRLLSHLDEPLTLSDVQCSNQSFKTELKTVRPGKEFELHLTAIPPFATATIQALVTLKTSSPKVPLLQVTAFGLVLQPVVVTPPQLMLPAGPWSTALQRSLLVQNNGTNALALSDPKINLPGIDVQLRELQPGRQFSLSLNFPATLELPSGQPIELSVKSNHPQYPLLKVPVIPGRPRMLPALQSAATPATNK